VANTQDRVERVKKYDVFVSHSSRDKNVADAIVANLESSTVKCWIAPRDIPAGADWPATIMDALEESRGMVVVVTSSSVDSQQVHREVGHAVNNGLFIIPFRAEDVPLSKNLAFYLQSPHWLDAITPPLQAHVDRLVAAVRGLLGKTSDPRVLKLERVHTRPPAESGPVEEIPPDEWNKRQGARPKSWFKRLLEEKE